MNTIITQESKTAIDDLLNMVTLALAPLLVHPATSKRWGQEQGNSKKASRVSQDVDHFGVGNRFSRSQTWTFLTGTVAHIKRYLCLGNRADI